MFCPKCGTENQDNNFKCTKCGEILHPSAPPIALASDDPLGGMIPTKNGPALAAYYIGIFSIIPFLGLPMGIVAVVLGIKGLRRAREHPEAKGKIHAWVGIIAGGLFALLSLLFIAVMLPIPGRS
jgi:hypothetical protein